MVIVVLEDVKWLDIILLLELIVEPVTVEVCMFVNLLLLNYEPVITCNWFASFTQIVVPSTLTPSALPSINVKKSVLIDA